MGIGGVRGRHPQVSCLTTWKEGVATLPSGKQVSEGGRYSVPDILMS